MTDTPREFIDVNGIHDLVEAEHEIISRTLYGVITKEKPTIVIQLASLTALAATAAMVSTSLSDVYISGPITFSEYFIMEFTNQLEAYREVKS